jgi:hypothetical protein
MRRWLLACGLLIAPMAPAEGAVADAFEECRCVGLLSSGALQLEANGRQREAELLGVEGPMPLPAEWEELILRRIPKSGYALRCEPRSAKGAKPERVAVSYHAWTDKSGEVYRDLAATLIDLGLARVASYDFPERAAYLAREQAARQKHIGIWKR